MLSRARADMAFVAVVALTHILSPVPVRSAEPSPLLPPPLAAPEVIERKDPSYPPEAFAAHTEASVVLSVIIGIDGAVGEVSVITSGGPAFDTAAIDAIRQWRFRPARSGDTPVPARIRVPFRFGLPPAPEAPQVVPTLTVPTPTTEPEPTTAPTEGEPTLDARVRGKRKPPARGPSDFILDRDTLALTPSPDAGAMLLKAPGVYVAKPEGDAVAHEVFLRGFDAEHGQDIAFSLGPFPLNQPSHLHGQGYADLNFIIPELVRGLRVTEGVYDPRQGDFAVAGSIDFDLAVAERGVLLATSFGSFGAWRMLGLWAPEGEPDETFAAFDLRRADGYGDNRGSLSGSTMGQVILPLPDAWRLTLLASAYSARANLAGVVRLEDVDAGRVGWFDSYTDPSANSQSAFTSRAQLGVTVDKASLDGARAALSLWILLSDFRLRENFTGYTERSQTHSEWVGRGDLIEQSNASITFGGSFLYQTPRLKLGKFANGHFELGGSFRNDRIEQAQNLLAAPQNETWDRRVDAKLNQLDMGFYADLDWRFWRVLSLRGGLRADALTFDIDDALGNFIPSFGRQTHILGFRRTALGFSFGPRVTVEYEPIRTLSVQASYGRGYRSPQARLLEEGENAPFSLVDSMEAGVRLRTCDDGKTATFTTALYRTALSSDLAFDAGEGRLEKIGPTTRTGVALQLVTHPWDWAFLSTSFTWVHATLDAPPPATAENPVPPFERGQLLPYVPPIVVRVDAGIEGDLVTLDGDPLSGRLGLGFTFLSARPLPFGTFADTVALLDLSASLRWRFVELGLDVFNVADTQWASAEYSFVSDWRTREVPSLVPARHISAGAPQSIVLRLALHL